MPTLIRLLVVLIILGGLGLAGMFALTIMVDPGEKDITIKIPPRELVANSPSSGPLDINNLPAPVNVAPKDEPSSGASEASSSAMLSIDTSDPEQDDSGVKTVDTGAE
jgi:hypothetical protein